MVYKEESSTFLLKNLHSSCPQVFHFSSDLKNIMHFLLLTKTLYFVSLLIKNCTMAIILTIVLFNEHFYHEH